MRSLVALDHVNLKFHKYRQVAFKDGTHEHSPELTGHHSCWDTGKRPKCYSNRRFLLQHCLADVGINPSVPLKLRHKIPEVLVVGEPRLIRFSLPVFGPSVASL